jgi:putative peptidoglycan lipid II flippase
LIRSIATVGGNTLLSRMLGFLRDLVIARVFGADAATDAFLVAFKIPNFMRRLFAEGAFSLAFVPVLGEYRGRGDGAALKGLIDRVGGTLAVALVPVTALGMLAAPALVALFAPGFTQEPGMWALASEMLRITFPYLPLIVLTAFAGAILHSIQRFAVPAFTPVLLNLCMIAAALELAPRLERPITALAWGVLAAGVAQLAFQVPFLGRHGLLPRPRFAPRDPGVRRVGRLMGPALLGVSVIQISLLLDTLLASFLSAGSISWLYYSNRLMELPQGLLGVALGTALLPRLTSLQEAQDGEGFSATLDQALRGALLLGLPAALGLGLLAEPIMATLFHSASFGPVDVVRSAASLRAYALGLPAYLAVKVLAPGYYARQDTRTPVRVALASLGANLSLSLALMLPLAHVGLALSASLAAGLNGLLLGRGLLLRGVLQVQPGWPTLLARVTLATVVMGLVLWVGSPAEGAWLAAGPLRRVTWLGLAILAGAGSYFVALFLGGFRLWQLRPSPVA